MLCNPDSKGFGQVQVGGKTFFGPCAVGLLGICDTITATTTCSLELHRSDKESLKFVRLTPSRRWCLKANDNGDAHVENDQGLEVDVDSSSELFRDSEEQADEFNYDYDDCV